MAKEVALLDSGANENCLDEQTWECLGIGRTALHKPIPVYNIDGTENKQGKLTHYCWLRIRFDNKEKLQRFFITSLGQDRIILGYPFLYEFNPTIDWQQGRLKGGAIQLQSARYKHVHA
jgi:hypothetical protein